MLECAVVFGTDYYGTPRSEVDPHRANGTGVILVIDVQGAGQVRRALPGRTCRCSSARRPSRNWRRGCAGGAIAGGAIQRRLATAREELARAGEFDHVIVNDDLDRAVGELERIIRARFTTREVSACSTS